MYQMYGLSVSIIEMPILIALLLITLFCVSTGKFYKEKIWRGGSTISAIIRTHRHFGRKMCMGKNVSENRKMARLESCLFFRACVPET